MQYASIPGQQEVKQQLRRYVNNRQLPHALLFSGAEGCGHLPLALAFCAHVLCPHATEDDSCSRCRPCRLVAQLVHPDVRFSMPVASLKKRRPVSSEFISEWRQAVQSNPYLTLNDWYEFVGFENQQGLITAEEAAEIVRALALKPVESRYRFVLIWMAERMRAEAANRLLKSIEEPEGNTIFILMTVRAESLPNTLLSRLREIRIPPFSLQAIEEMLCQRYTLKAATCRRIALLSDGNMSRAFTLASEAQLHTPVENDFLNWMRHCYALSLPSNSAQDPFSRLIDWIEHFASQGRENQKNFILTGLEFIRQCLIRNYLGEEHAFYTDHIIPNFSKFSRFIHAENIGELEALLNNAYYHIERNANPRILFLHLSFQVHHLLKRSVAVGMV
jgi:DNA polymerase-3 subunit delta'